MNMKVTVSVKVEQKDQSAAEGRRFYSQSISRRRQSQAYEKWRSCPYIGFHSPWFQLSVVNRGSRILNGETPEVETS